MQPFCLASYLVMITKITLKNEFNMPNAKDDSSEVKYEVGDIVQVETFAGPKVYKKVVKKIDTTTSYKSDFLGDIRVKGFDGVFTRKKDILALKRMCVPYSGRERPSKVQSFTYDWQIIKIVKKRGS